MDDIAHELSMSKRTLYQIFKDKEELLMACLDHRMEIHQQEMQTRLLQTDNVLELVLSDLESKFKYFRQVSPLFFSELVRYPRVVEKFETIRRLQRERAVEFLSRGVEQGLFLPHVNFLLFYDIVTQHSVSYEKMLSLNYPPFELFLHMAFYNLRGITTAKGAKMMDDFRESLFSDAM